MPDQFERVRGASVRRAVRGRCLHLAAKHQFSHSHSIVPGGFEVTS
jgi:hypothetical protein